MLNLCLPKLLWLKAIKAAPCASAQVLQLVGNLHLAFELRPSLGLHLHTLQREEAPRHRDEEWVGQLVSPPNSTNVSTSTHQQSQPP